MISTSKKIGKYLVVSALFSTLLTTAPASAWSDPTISVATLGGSDFEYSYAIEIDSNGNIYTAGVFNGTVDFDPGDGTSNLTATSEAAFISKLDVDGNFLWVKKIDGASDQAIKSLAIDSSGNILATGYFYRTVDFDPGAATSNLTNSGGSDVFVLKLDSDGGFIWAKSFGGSDDDTGYSLASDSSGNIYTTGEFYSSVDFDPSGGVVTLTAVDWGDAFVSKLDSSGNFIWARQLGGSGFEQGKSIAVDGNGDVVTTGYFYGEADFDPGLGTAALTSNGGSDAFISKLTSSGNFDWVGSFGGSGGDQGQSITVDGSGNIYTVGHFTGTVDFDGGRSEANLTATGSRDVVVLKYNVGGGFIWAKQLGGSSYEDANSVVVDLLGNVYTTGYFHQTADFDPGSSNAELTSAGDTDAFISKLDSSGNYLWGRNIGGAGADESLSIALNGTGSVFTTGYFEGTADFDPESNTANLTAAGDDDIFILRLNSSGNASSFSSSSSSSSSSSLSSSPSSSSSPSANADLAAEAAAAAAAAAAQRQAEIRDARAELSRKSYLKEELSVQLFTKANISGLTSGNIKAAQAEIFELSDLTRAEITQIIKVARKYEVIELIASERVNQVLSNLYVEIGLIPADSKNKIELVRAFRRLSSEDRSTYELIKSAVEKEVASIKRRNEHLALVLSRNSTRIGK